MKIGVVGAGIMGRAVAERFLAAGKPVTVWNRTREKAEPILAAGAEWAESPADAAARSDVVISLVTNPEAVEQVAQGPEGVLEGLSADSVHLEMSTVSPSSSGRLAEQYREAGRRFVQAPVLGGRTQIAAGELLILAGGAADDIERCGEALDLLAKRVWRFEFAGQAATTKLACNMLLAHLMVGLAQSMIFASAGDVDPATLLEIIGESALAAPMFATKGKAILDRNFAPNFTVCNLEKDLRLAEEASKELRQPLLPNVFTRQLFRSADASGWGEEDYSAVMKVLEDLMNRYDRAVDNDREGKEPEG